MTAVKRLTEEQLVRRVARGDRSQTAGRLARQLACTPSVITHHLRALEAAGLVHRVRQGRHVVVQRSSRGRDLLALCHW